MESMKLNRNSTKLGNRVCIIQGEIALGKSYVIFSLGKKLIIYQMNSDSSLSIFLNQLKENEYFELRKNLSKIKFIQELTLDFEPNEENFYN